MEEGRGKIEWGTRRWERKREQNKWKRELETECG